MSDTELTFQELLSEHTKEEVLRYEELKHDIRELKETVDNLVQVWSQAKGALSTVKWIIAVLGSVGTFILFIKDHVK